MAYHLQKHCRINVLAVEALLIIAFTVQARYPFKAVGQGLHAFTPVLFQTDLAISTFLRLES